MIPKKPASEWSEIDIRNLTSSEFSSLSLGLVMNLSLPVLATIWSVHLIPLKKILLSPMFDAEVGVGGEYLSQFRALLNASRQLFTADRLASLLRSSGLLPTLTKQEFGFVLYSFASWNVDMRTSVTSANFALVSREVLQSLTIYQICEITEQQLKVMSVEQRSGLQWAINTAAANYSTTASAEGMLRLIRTGMAVGMLGRSMVQLMDLSVMGALTAAEFFALNDRVNQEVAVGGAGWSVTQVRALSNAALDDFKSANILNGQPTQFLGKLGSEQILRLLKAGALSAAGAARLDRTELAKISLSAIAQLSRTEFSNFSVAINLLTVDQMQAITIDNLGNALGKNFALLNVASYANFSDVQWATSTSALAMFGELKLGAMTSAQLAALPDMLLRKLSPYLLSQLPLAQGSALLSLKKGVLTAAQIAVLPTDATTPTFEFLVASYIYGLGSLNAAVAQTGYYGSPTPSIIIGDQGQTTALKWAQATGALGGPIKAAWPIAQSQILYDGPPAKANAVKIVELMGGVFRANWTAEGIKNLSGTTLQNLLSLYQNYKTNPASCWDSKVCASFIAAMERVVPSGKSLHQVVAENISAEALPFLDASQFQKLLATGALAPSSWVQLNKTLFLQVLADFYKRFGGAASQSGGKNASMINALNNLCSSSLAAALPMTWLSESTSWNLARLEASDVSALALSTVRLITAADFVRIPLTVLQQFSKNQMSAILPPTISALKDILSTFNADQLKGLVPEQAALISATQVTKFSTDQFKAVVSALAASMSGEVIRSLSPEQIAALPTGVINSVVSVFGLEQLSALTAAQVKALRPVQVWAMSVEQLKMLGNKVASLSALAVMGLSKAQVEGNTFFSAMSTKPVGLMNRAQLEAVVTADIRAISGYVLAQIADVTWLKRAQMLALGAEQISQFSADQLSKFAVKPVLMMTAEELTKLSVSEFAALPSMTVAQLGPLQVKALTVDQLRALTQAQIMVIGAEITRYFSITQWKAFSSTQLAFFQDEALSELSDTAKASIAGAGLAFPSRLSSLLTPAKLWKISPVIALARNVYSTQHAARALSGFEHALHGGLFVQQELAPTNTGMLTVTQMAAIENSKKAWLEYRERVGDARKNLNGGRLLGSLLSMSAVSDMAVKMWMDKDDAQALAQDIVTELLWFSSLLQVPMALLVNILDKYTKVKNAALISEELRLGVANLSGEARVSAQALANENAKATAKATISTTFKNFVGLEKMIPLFSIAADRQVGRPGGNTLTATLSLVSQGVESSFTLNNSRIEVIKKNKWLGISLGQWNNIERRSWGSVEMRYEAKFGAMLIATDLLTMVQGLYTLSTDSAKNGFERALAVANITLGLSLFVGDVIPLLIKTEASTVAGISAISKSQLFLGVGTVGLFLVGQVNGSIQAHLDYTKDPTTGKLVGVILNDVFAAINIGIMAVAFVAAGGPLGLAAAIAALAIPNPAAIGQAIDLKKQRDLLASTGRTIVAEYVMKDLYNIACLNATPILNLTAFIYTPVILKQIRDRMSRDNYSLAAQAAAQDFAYQAVYTSGGQGFVNALLDVLKGSTGLMGVRYIAAGTFLAKDYYAAADTDTTTRVQYISQEGVRSSEFSKSKDLLDTSLNAGGRIVLSSAYDTEQFGDKTLREFVYIDRQADTGATQDIFIDAAASSRSRTYAIGTDHVTIKVGESINKYIVSLDKVADLSSISVIRDSVAQSTAPAYAANADEMQLITTQAIDKTYRLNLDAFDGVTVGGVENLMDYQANMSITGSKAGRRYKTAGGVDAVNLTGGNSFVIAGGSGTIVQLAGGLNLAYAALGIMNRDTLADGIYTGGSITKGSDGKDRENTINFSASGQPLKLEIVDPGVAGYSRASTLYASGDLKGFTDIVKFTQFQNIIGSNLGDYITVKNTTTLNELRLGMGANSVVVSNSSNVKITTGINADLISLESGNDIFVESRGRGTVYDEGATSLYVNMLGEGDTLDLGNNRTGDVMVRSGTGMHDVNLFGNLGKFEVLPQYRFNRTTINDVSDRTAVLDLQIGQDISAELIRWDSVLERLEMYSNDNDQFVAFDIDNRKVGAANAPASTSRYVTVSAFDSANVVTASMNYLIEAMAAIPTAQMTTTSLDGKNWQGYNMTDVFAKVSLLHPQTT